MGAFTKKKATPAASFFDDIEEAPRAGLEPAQAIKRRSIRTRWVIRITLVLALVTTVLSFLALAFNFNTDSTDNTTSVDVTNPPGRSVAWQTVNEWITGNTALHGGKVLSWDSATQQQWTDLDRDSDGQHPDYQLWTHTFTLTKDARFYETSVKVAVSDVLGERVIAGPSLMERAPSDDTFGSVSGWPGLVSATVTQPVTEAITQWASLYTGSDPTQLRLATGDPNTSHSYQPLTGAAGATAEIDWSAIFPSGEGEPDKTDVMVVQTRLLVPPSGDALTADPDAKPVTITFDVRVENADTASPRVVAWGGPGSGPTLRAYQNAVDSSRVNSPEPTPDTTEPATTPDAKDSNE